MNSKGIALGVLSIGALGTILWGIDKSMQARPGASGNNGYTEEMRGPSPELRKSMEKRMSEARDGDMPTNPQEGMRRGMEMMKELPEEQQQEMRQMMEEGRKRMERTRAVLGDEESRQMMKRAMQTFGRMRRQREAAEKNDGPQE